MKTFNKAIALIILSSVTATAQIDNPPAPTSPQVTSTGANFNVWQWQTFDTMDNGQVVAHTHTYTELASGLNYLDSVSGQWIPSQESIQPFAQGAIAKQGQHQIIFASDLNTSGAIDEQTPDGKRLTSNILGLMYYDPVSGQSAQIAVIQDSEGELIAANQVLYTNAFNGNGITADVLYTYRRDGMEQDVVLRSQLPSPESLGLGSGTVELEVVTEFINPPEASVWNVGMDSEGLEPDQAVVWGATSLGRGRAFSLAGQDVSAPVIKQYVNVQGHYYLLEKVRFQDVQQALQSLPEQASNARKLPAMASGQMQLPKSVAGKRSGHAMRLAFGPLGNLNV